MSDSNNDNLELDITRMLDGELSDAEQAGLSRRLVRDPAAHRLADKTAAVDAFAGEALRSAFAAGETEAGARLPLDNVGPVRRETRFLAVAAAVIVLASAGVLVWHTVGGEEGLNGGPRREVAKVRPADEVLEVDPISAGAEQVIWQVWDAQSGESAAPREADTSLPLPSTTGPRDVQRRSDRQLYGMYDEETQTIYLLGVDHVKTKVREQGWDM